MIVFTIHGSKILECSFDLAFVASSPFTIERGFDFVLVPDENRVIHVVEVFNLKVMNRVWSCPSSLGIFKYDERRQGRMVAAHNGCSCFVQFQARETIPILEK
jgi:hypothetical protein